MLVLLIGCGEKKAETDKPKVVSKKISMPATQKPESEKKTAETKEISDKAVKKEAEAPLPPPKALPLLAELGKDKQTETVVLIYNPEGKIDPFMPLFKEEPVEEEAQPVAKKLSRKKRVATTPLERISLNQLKLVATIRAASGNRALVEDAAGKGYIVKMGTYIGINSGSVVDIQKDRLIVEEEVETLLGEITIQKRELKLQKPPGE
jgi:type IV pilus assembly protein PilP